MSICSLRIEAIDELFLCKIIKEFLLSAGFGHLKLGSAMQLI